MRVSLKEVSKYVNFSLPKPNEVVEKVGLQLGAVDEGVFDLSEVYKDALIVKVVSAEPIKGTDHLNLCFVDDGNKTKVQRNSDGYIQVVCGAPNVRAGIRVVYLPPESIVPVTHGKEEFKLSVREIRGVKSYGMLASASELAVNDDHSGLLELDKGNPGDAFMEVYELDDIIIDIENKMFTHRPDCFGQIGVAREVAGIFNKSFNSPDWYKKLDKVLKQDNNNLPISVVNEIPGSVPRFTAVSISGIKIVPSPIELQILLTKLGVRPINNIVDITNLVMLTTAQPMHAYDWDKLNELSQSNPKIVVRSSKKDEKLELLNSKVISVPEDSIVIATDKKAIGLGGVMGGANSEVDNNTTNIVLESACFDMYKIRKTSMHAGIFSDAVTRFNKGQSPLQNLVALNYAIMLIKEHCGPNVRISSKVIDVNELDKDVIKNQTINPPVSLNLVDINNKLGTNLNINQVKNILANVEFDVRVGRGDNITVKAPYWRTDIEIKEDVIEEVGRLYGFQHIEAKPIVAAIIPPTPEPLISLKKQIRTKLSQGGANELLCYSFVSNKLIKNSFQDASKAIRLSNPLSPELNYYRMSLTPSLLSKVHQNIKLGYDKFAVFEIGKFHLSNNLVNKIPAEYNSLSLVYASKRPTKNAAYYSAVKYLDYLISGLTYDLIPLSEVKIPSQLRQVFKPYDESRSAGVCIENKIVGVIGEFKQSVTQSLKLPSYTSGFEILIDDLKDKLNSVSYQTKSKYPEIKQDLTFKTASNVNYSNISVNLYQVLAEILGSSESYFLMDYLGSFSKDSGYINYTFRVTIGSYNRTLEDKIVNQKMDQVALQMKKIIKAERV